jgi:uncharacterized membrane protein
MAPLIIMIVAWIAFRIAGMVGFAPSDSWNASMRFALAVMFFFTAVSHFVPKTRDELIKMVPPAFGHPAALVTLTGFLETAGATGLLVPVLVRPAALALAALMVAMFPANIRAARNGLSVGGHPAMPLRFRLPLQLLWIAMLAAVAVHYN